MKVVPVVGKKKHIVLVAENQLKIVHAKIYFMKPKKIPITTAKDIANNLHYDEVIIVGCHYETGIQHVTTYGKSVASCENAAKGGNAIKKLLGWPEDKCNAVPKRAKGIAILEQNKTGTV